MDSRIINCFSIILFVLLVGCSAIGQQRPDIDQFELSPDPNMMILTNGNRIQKYVAMSTIRDSIGIQVTSIFTKEDSVCISIGTDTLCTHFVYTNVEDSIDLDWLPSNTNTGIIHHNGKIVVGGPDGSAAPGNRKIYVIGDGLFTAKSNPDVKVELENEDNRWILSTDAENFLIHASQDAKLSIKTISDVDVFALSMINGDIIHGYYPNSRDDTGDFPPKNFLYTDSLGIEKSGPISIFAIDSTINKGLSNSCIYSTSFAADNNLTIQDITNDIPPSLAVRDSFQAYIDRYHEGDCSGCILIEAYQNDPVIWSMDGNCEWSNPLYRLSTRANQGLRTRGDTVQLGDAIEKSNKGALTMDRYINMNQNSLFLYDSIYAFGQNGYEYFPLKIKSDYRNDNDDELRNSFGIEFIGGLENVEVVQQISSSRNDLKLQSFSGSIFNEGAGLFFQHNNNYSYFSVGDERINFQSTPPNQSWISSYSIPMYPAEQRHVGSDFGHFLMTTNENQEMNWVKFDTLVNNLRDSRTDTIYILYEGGLNMFSPNSSDTFDSTPDSRIQVFDHCILNTWFRANPANGPMLNDVPCRSFEVGHNSIAFQFAKRYIKEHPQSLVRLVGVPDDDASITEFNGSGGDAQWIEMVGAIQAAGVESFHTVLLHIGEDDAANNLAPSTFVDHVYNLIYRIDTLGLIDRYRTPIILGALLENTAQAELYNDEVFSKINSDGHNNVAVAINGEVQVKSLKSINGNQFTNDAIDTLGLIYYQTFKSLPYHVISDSVVSSGGGNAVSLVPNQIVFGGPAGEHGQEPEFIHHPTSNNVAIGSAATSTGKVLIKNDSLFTGLELNDHSEVINSSPAHNWGIYNSINADNYFKTNLGIGIDTPKFELDVIGDWRLRGKKHNWDYGLWVSDGDINPFQSGGRITPAMGFYSQVDSFISHNMMYGYGFSNVSLEAKKIGGEGGSLGIYYQTVGLNQNKLFGSNQYSNQIELRTDRAHFLRNSNLQNQDGNVGIILGGQWGEKSASINSDTLYLLDYVTDGVNARNDEIEATHLYHPSPGDATGAMLMTEYWDAIPFVSGKVRATTDNVYDYSVHTFPNWGTVRGWSTSGANTYNEGVTWSVADTAFIIPEDGYYDCNCSFTMRYETASSGEEELWNLMISDNDSQANTWFNSNFNGNISPRDKTIHGDEILKLEKDDKVKCKFIITGGSNLEIKQISRGSFSVTRIK